MGKKYRKWMPAQHNLPASISDLQKIIWQNRKFLAVDQLNYGDHGLHDAASVIAEAIRQKKRIALYADYDVDGTMSCVSWIWYLQALGHQNFVPYIPCRFEEGYGLNLKAIEHLIDEEKADLIITMDTGITANAEAAYCRSRGVEFICTDHHKIQPEKMPDCIILNPKMHPDSEYQEMCGAGITFVLLRKLAQEFPIGQETWSDILALVGMATICDVVPLNGVNHKLANLGVKALMRSSRPVLRRLREACALEEGLDEKDVGFRIGPRINAVGRLNHAKEVIKAFLHDDPEPLVEFMGSCNEERKLIQTRIVSEAHSLARMHNDDPILFLGKEGWHPGVVGIAASKITETYWKPTWLFERKGDICKGSARSLPGFDVTDAMTSAAKLFTKFGGHAAAGGFTFPAENEDALRMALNEFARDLLRDKPEIWLSKVSFDTQLPLHFLDLSLAESLDTMKPFGHGFEEPLFCIEADIKNVRFLLDKATGAPKHTAVQIEINGGRGSQKLMFFNEVHEELEFMKTAKFLVTATKNTFRGTTNLSLIGKDWEG